MKLLQFRLSASPVLAAYPHSKLPPGHLSILIKILVFECELEILSLFWIFA